MSLSDCLGESCAQTLLLCSVSCSLLPVIQEDAEWGEAQVCVVLSQSWVRADPGKKMNAPKMQTKSLKNRNIYKS